MWGKGGLETTRNLLYRFNPTCVGKSKAWKIGTRFTSVQPHVCGEKQGMENRNSFHVGSTSHMWGKDKVSMRGTDRIRFNPTCVGKRGSFFLGSSICPVQPHVCGEKSFRDRVEKRGVGSTPRVWGKDKQERDRFPPLLVQPHVCGEKTKSLYRINPDFLQSIFGFESIYDGKSPLTKNV